MSVEQWGLVVLVVLLPLLEGVARFRRAHASNGAGIGRVGEVRTSQRAFSLPLWGADDTVGLAAEQLVSPPSSLPPPLPHLVRSPAISLSGLPASLASSLKGSASFEARTGIGRPGAGDGVVQWLRHRRNLRRAIVVATILGPPTQ